jgi:putative Ca2+/H+ antiporter (TMEM165/GDT1 family)
VFDLIVIATVFGIVFVGELPDKTAVAALVLGARYRPLPVLAGIWLAFLVHVVVAVTLGGLIAALPRTPVEIVSGVLFLGGAVLLLRSDPEEAQKEGREEAEGVTGERKGLAVSISSFGVVLVAEFGDLTQILTATLAARYDNPVSVGIGALLALWAVSALAVTFGQGLLKLVPLKRVQQLAAVILIVLSVVSIVGALL